MKIIQILLFLSVLTSCQSNSSNNSEKNEANEQLTKSTKITTATLRVLQGKIIMKFFPNKAPLSVQRFTELIEAGFFNGLTFHRVVPGFVVQSGDPTGTGTGGSGRKLKAEFNDIPHVKGTVALARTNDPNSADSQFYITMNTFDELNGKYTVIGQVIQGLEILEKIKKGDKIISFTLKKH